MDEKEILNYLLGRLPAENEFDFLAASFATDESAEQYEIVREYLRRNLSTKDKEDFEKHFLKNPLHRELLFFSKKLRQMLKGWKEAGDEKVK